MANGARSARAPTTMRRSRSSVAQPCASNARPPRLYIPDEPPKVPRRPPSKGNKRETLKDIAKRIPIHIMRQYFNYPLRSAAEAMHISVTTLKRLCRLHGVKRWPHRQISGINKTLSDLEAQHEEAGGGDAGAVADQLRQLHSRREVIIELAFESDEEMAKTSLNTPLPAAHRRGNRGRTPSDAGSSSAGSGSVASVSTSRNDAPDSPASVTSVGESTPTSVWWQHTPASVDSSSANGPIKRSRGGSTNSSTSGVGRPRKSASGPGLSRGRAPRAQRSSTVFGTLGRPGRDGTNSHPCRKISGNTPAAAVSDRRFSNAPSSLSGAAAASRSSAAAGVGAPAGCHPLSVTVASAGRSGCNIFEESLPVNQHMDDIASLGELLFGPDETAAAAEAQDQGLTVTQPGSLLHDPSQWASYVPFCPPGVFSHDHMLVDAPSVSSCHEQGGSSMALACASNWVGFESDRSGLLGTPTSSAGPT